MKLKLTIPGFIPEWSSDLEHLMLKFGHARRRAYSMIQGGVDRLAALKRLCRETGLPTRYIYAAYDTVKSLPPHATFGGLKLQRRRERGEISHEEYHRRRNNILVCRGDRSRKGNLCLRVEGNKLRVNVGPRKWARLPLFIPRKYANRLDRASFYTVLLRRRSDRPGYDVRITVPAGAPEVPERGRVMALDLNAGHIDFAVVGKEDLKLVAAGRINCYELLDAKKGKNKIIIHRVVDKIGNIAGHYGAEVVAGKLWTGSFNRRRRANRKIHRMCQFEIRRVMSYKLPLRGVSYRERSEAYTTRVGEVLSRPMGLDVHKAAAYAFAVKVADYERFRELRSSVRDEKFPRGVRADEGDGSFSARLSAGSGLTAPRQASHLARDEAKAEATPRFLVGAGGTEPLQPHILQVKV